jgi:transketolase C-terminal domain/subunit
VKKNLSELNNHLFAEIERLGDGCLKGEELTVEIGRAKAVCGVAMQIIANGRLVLDAARAADTLPGVKKQPMLLE